MTLALVVQILAALGGAWVGVVGLDKGQLNALAFGVLVPMFGIGMNGVWAALARLVRTSCGRCGVSDRSRNRLEQSNG